jgi:hypothetical protein
VTRGCLNSGAAVLARALLIVFASVGAWLGPARAEEGGGALRRFLFDDALALVHVRSYYRERDRPPPLDNWAAWATGGWVGYETGWLLDTFRVGGVVYTSQPFWAPQDTDGTRLLLPKQTGYTVLGQAFAQLKWHDQIFTFYRQLVDEFEVNPRDNRMTPNTFEAYALRGRLGDVTYFAGYVASMKGRDEVAFYDMAKVAGAPEGVSAGMGLVSLRYDAIPGLRLRTSAYHVPDILTSSYSEAIWTRQLGDDFGMRLSGNFMVQGSTGLHLLTGEPFSTFSAGIRGELMWGPANLQFIYTNTGTAAQYRSPYGVWIGYTKQLMHDFDRAGEQAFKVHLNLDFASVGLPGLLLDGSVTSGRGALVPNSGLQLPDNTEYNLDLHYRFNFDERWPDWLKTLSLRGRIGWLDSSLYGYTTHTTEYRAILNYTYRFEREGRPR